MSVWAEFGPYKTAADAQESMMRVCRIVLGVQMQSSKGWIEEDICNFNDWEEKGTFGSAQEMYQRAFKGRSLGPAFDAACRQVMSELEAEAIELAEKLNGDLEH